MARHFDGAGDKIRVALGNLNFNDNLTIASIMKVESVSSWRNIMTMHGSDNLERWSFEITDQGHLFLGTPTGSTAESGPFIETDKYYLVVVTKATGTTTPRFHTYNFSTNTWVHQNASGSFGNGPAVGAGGYIEFGLWQGIDDFLGDIEVGGVWNRVLTDAEVELLAVDLLNWIAQNPNGLWQLNQSDITQKVADITGGGANESAITGTTIATVSVPLFNQGGVPIIGRSGRITSTRQQIIQGLARIRKSVTQTITGKAKINQLPQTRTNLIENPSFENNITDYWDDFSSSGAPIRSRDTTVASKGSASYKHDANGVNTDSGIEKFVPGGFDVGTYRLSGKIKRTGLTGSANLVVRRNTDFGADVNLNLGTGTDADFQYVTGTFVVSTAGVPRTILMGIGPYGTPGQGVVHFDEIRLEKISDASIDEGYFDGDNGGVWTGTAHNSTSTWKRGEMRGKARITAAFVSQTITGLARIRKSVTQTITGKSRIQKSVLQTITGKARVTATTTKTQTGKAAIRRTFTQTIQGLSRIRQIVNQTVTGKSRITASTTKTQTGTARIRKVVSQTITGISRIRHIVNQTITGVARITASTLRTQTGKARIRVSVSQTQTGTSRIRQTVNVVITGLARVRKVVNQTQTGVARIRQRVDQTIQGRARITALSLQNQLGRARIRQLVNQNQSGRARIQVFVLRTILGHARIQKVLNATIQGKANISNLTRQTQTGKAAIRNVTIQTIQGRAMIIPKPRGNTDNVLRARPEAETLLTQRDGNTVLRMKGE